jgi:glycosyltransferase involved in cell wall biosynthesis
MNYLEESYISVVAVARNDAKIIEGKTAALCKFLENSFKYFEVIVVNNYSDDRTAEILEKMPLPVTVVTLTRLHNTQQALAAGVEIAIGDYIVEIPDMNAGYDEADILELYETCRSGNDFVFFVPVNVRFTSLIFYKFLNRYFKGKISSPVSASVMTLSSRRGQNKTADVGKRLVNRNVSYVLTGLRCASLEKDIRYRNRRSFSENVGLMMDTLFFYTDCVSRAVAGIAFLFFGLTFFGIAYAFAVYFVMDTAPGWASSFILNSSAFCALFAILSVLCRYLSHILSSQNAKMYVFHSLVRKEKGQK